MFTYSLAKKVPGLIMVVVLAILLSLVLLFTGGPDITAPMSNAWGHLFSWLTDSAGKPFFLITTALLCLIPLIEKDSKQKWVKVCFRFGVLLILCFVAKSGLKHLTKEPRPYTHELQALHLVASPQQFYAMDKVQKEAVIAKADGTISPWRVQNWGKDMNYSFPSGHSIFASLVVIIWAGYFFTRRQWLPMGIVLLWALGVCGSRVWLGMHWPHDVFGSMLCAAILHLLVPEWKEAEPKTRAFKYRR